PPERRDLLVGLPDHLGPLQRLHEGTHVLGRRCVRAPGEFQVPEGAAQAYLASLPEPRAQQRDPALEGAVERSPAGLRREAAVATDEGQEGGRKGRPLRPAAEQEIAVGGVLDAVLAALQQVLDAGAGIAEGHRGRRGGGIDQDVLGVAQGGTQVDRRPLAQVRQEGGGRGDRHIGRDLAQEARGELLVWPDARDSCPGRARASLRAQPAALSGSAARPAARRGRAVAAVSQTASRSTPRTAATSNAPATAAE